MGDREVPAVRLRNVRFIRWGGARVVREVWQPELWSKRAESERIPFAAIPAACGRSLGLASEIVDRVEQLVRERSRRWPATRHRRRQAGFASGVCGVRDRSTTRRRRERARRPPGDRHRVRTHVFTTRRSERSLKLRRLAGYRTNGIMAVRCLGGAAGDDDTRDSRLVLEPPNLRLGRLRYAPQPPPNIRPRFSPPL